MSLEEFAAINSLVAAFGIGAGLAAVVAFLAIKFYLSSYLTEKGKNLATREDVEAITDKVESVRTQYATLIEELKARHQLRLAAVDRRLQAHQEAFMLWRKLTSATYTDEIGKVVMECQAWWEQNCIYLEPTVREAFVVAYGAAHGHNALLRSRPDVKIVEESWSRVTGFPNILFKAVQLPTLSELEAKVLGVTDEKHKGE
jgi:hypothetical protein